MRNQGLEKPAKAKLKDKVANHKEEIDAQESPQHPRKEGDSYLEKWCKTPCLFVRGKYSYERNSLFVNEKCLWERTPKQRSREQIASLVEWASQGLRE